MLLFILNYFCFSDFFLVSPETEKKFLSVYSVVVFGLFKAFFGIVVTSLL